MNNTTSNSGSNASTGGFVVSTNVKIRIFIYSVSFALSIFGNSLVIVLGIRRRRRNTSCRILMTHLAFSDVLFSLRIPGEIHLELTNYLWTEGDILCRVYYGMSSLSLMASIYTMASIAIERYRGVNSNFSRPWRYRDAYILMIVTWIIAISTYIPYMLALQVRGNSCTDIYPSKRFQQIYSLCIFIMKYIIPLTIVSICYCKVISKIRNRPRINAHVHKRSIAEQKREMDNKRVIKVVIAVVVAFAVLTLPASIWWIIYDFSDIGKNKKALNLIEVFATFVYLYSGVNPIIYGIMDSRFRAGLRSLLPCKGKVVPIESSNMRNF